MYFITNNYEYVQLVELPLNCRWLQPTELKGMIFMALAKIGCEFWLKPIIIYQPQPLAEANSN